MLKKLGPCKTLGNLITCDIVACFAQPPRKVETRRVTVPWKLKEPVFILTILINLLSALTMNIPMGLGPDLSRALGYSARTSALLLALNNGIGSPSKIAIGRIVDKAGHQGTLSIAMVITTLSTWLIGAKTGTKCMWLTLIIPHGLAGGVFPILYGNVNVQLFSHEIYFASTAVFSCARGVGYLVGVPIAGAILGDVKDRDIVHQGFTRMIIHIGFLMLMCTSCTFAVRILDGKGKGWKLIA